MVNERLESVPHVQCLGHLFRRRDAEIRDGHTDVPGSFAQPLIVCWHLSLFGEIQKERDVGGQETQDPPVNCILLPCPRVWAGQQAN